LIQGYGVAVSLENSQGIVLESGFYFRLVTTITLLTGTMLLMWLGEQITARGIGNGISLIIFAGIVAEIPGALASTFELGRTGAISAGVILIIITILIAAIYFIVFVERAQRKILIHYPKRQIGNKLYGGDASHLPLKVNTAGVIPAIFASALLILPITISNFTSSSNEIVVGITSMLGQGKPLYMIIYAAGIIFFSFFYTSIIFNPKETAENLRKYGGFVPGIRPGEQTEQFIDQLLFKLTAIGSLYLVLICLLPELIIANYPIPFYLGGTSLLIVAVVAMDTVAQVQTRLMSQQYESLIKKTKFNR
jgi:preprotein translocase subunit SecY